jgi:transposase
MMPGVNVSALARAHGLTPQQVFGWRRKALADAGARIHGPAFAVVTVDAEEETGAGDTVELVIGEVTVRLGPDVAPARITAIVRAIRAA